MNIYKHPKLQEAFDIYVREQNSRLPGEEELAEIAVSDEFKARMEKLLRRQRRGYYVLFGTTARRVASFVVALLLAMTVTTFSVEALRQPVVRFFTEVFETFTRVIFVDDTSDPEQVEMEKRAPSYIPDGYVIESEIDAGALYRITYVNTEMGEKIFYRQQQNDENNMIIDTENSAYQDIVVGGFDGFSYKSSEKEYIVFADEKYAFSVSGSVSQEELLRVAESIFW